jgi:hypoxanthine phosphoribosyltransferase
MTLMPAEGSRELPPVLISEEEISGRVDELAAQISLDYADAGEVILIGVLKGAFVFLADLARRLTIERRIEFIALSSYQYGAESGAVRLLMDVRTDVRGRHVLIVEDIVDTANTLHYLIDMLRAREPASLRCCALVRKKERIRSEVEVDYVGFDIPDRWVVGYGLDLREQYRTLPYIGIVDP